MSITRFDPFRHLTAWQDQMNRMFDTVRFQPEESTLTTWAPSVDI